MMNHDFWLIEEQNRASLNLNSYAARRDAPVQIHEDHLRYLADTLAWIPTNNPAKQNEAGYGLNWWGLTIINKQGGQLLQRICTAWAQLFSYGPETLPLTGMFGWQWPFEENEHMVSASQLSTFGSYNRLHVERDNLVQALTMLAHFGEQTSTGKFIILHIGI